MKKTTMYLQAALFTARNVAFAVAFQIGFLAVAIQAKALLWLARRWNMPGAEGD